MKVLVTGANGMVAQAVIGFCGSIGDDVVSYTRQSLDISNKQQVLGVFKNEKPDAVINCAAYTDVDGSEKLIKRCYKVNAQGVENLALAAKKVDSAFVTISTDYVFDGAKSGFYTQRDTPNPQGVYAKAKLGGEILARNAYARSIIVRSGWIYGKSGTNFMSLLRDRLAAGKTIPAICDSYGTPTLARDLARRLRELAEMDLPEIFHVTNSGEGASYAEFARKVCELEGFDPNLIESVSFKNLKRSAPRPVNSKLACLFSEKLGLSPLPSWEKALAEFLEIKR